MEYSCAEIFSEHFNQYTKSCFIIIIIIIIIIIVIIIIIIIKA